MRIRGRLRTPPLLLLRLGRDEDWLKLVFFEVLGRARLLPAELALDATNDSFAGAFLALVVELLVLLLPVALAGLCFTGFFFSGAFVGIFVV